MAEIPKFAFLITGALIAVVSAVVNWKKFFLFILVGVIFIIYGLGKKKIKQAPVNPYLRQQNYARRYSNINKGNNINKRH